MKQNKMLVHNMDLSLQDQFSLNTWLSSSSLSTIRPSITSFTRISHLKKSPEYEVKKLYRTQSEVFDDLLRRL